MSEAKARIISHMNKDHQLALLDYVTVYGKADPKSIDKDSVKMTEVDEKLVSITYSTISGDKKYFKILWSDAEEGKDVVVNSLLDIRAKTVAMAEYAAELQGYSYKQLNKVVLPGNVFEWTMYVYAAFTLITLYDQTLIRRIVSNEAVLKKALSYVPAVFGSVYDLFEENIRNIALGLYAVHLTEIYFLSWPKLVKYRVPTPKRVGWLAMHVIEGFMVPLRLTRALESGSH